MFICRPAVETMLEHARQDLPNECCGLLLGTVHTIEEVVRARNVKLGPTRFEIDPRDHIRSIRSARAEGRRLIGAYHSYPGVAAVPSQIDLDEATYPEYL